MSLGPTLSGSKWDTAPFGTPEFANGQVANYVPPAVRSVLRFQDAQVVRELNFGDYIDTSSFTDCTAALQNFLLYCQMVALIIKSTSLDNLMQRVSVRAYIPRGRYNISSPIIVPEYVSVYSDGLIVRSFPSGGGTDTFTGDPASNAFANIYQPAFIVPARAHVEKIDIYCNPDGVTAHQGSGLVVGKNWVMAGVTVQAIGSGYSVNDVLTLTNPSKSPFLSATVTVNTINGSGGILTYTLATGGAYGLPSFLQAYQWTSTNGFSVFDGAGNFLTTGGTGTGATFSAAWAGDFANINYSVGNNSLITDTILGHIRVQQAGISFDGTTHGSTFGLMISGFNARIDDVEIFGGNVGMLFYNASDIRCDAINCEQGATGISVFGGSSIECPNVVLDSALQTSLQIDQATGVIFKGRCFTNFALSPSRPGTPGAILIGTHSTINSGGLDLDFTLDGCGTYFANAVNPAIVLQHIVQSTINLKIVNGNGSQNPYTSHLINQYAEIGVGFDAGSVQLFGSINNATGPIFINSSDAALTPACGTHIWDASVQGFAGTSGTYQLFGSGHPTSGGSGTGAGKAGPGSSYADYTNARVYLNTNTAASPTWTLTGASTKSVQVPTTGFNIIMTTQKLMLNPGGALATGTITFANSPVDGQVSSICSTQQVTTITWAAGTGGAAIIGLPTFLSPGVAVNSTYDTASNAWYPS